ncbi:maleylpyruvate isomerase N-terminal domain-containing protein [Nitriliruptor alkaliphilus]|uniref:maleylpyruvate isomerase N-terminal domain-containing protein n=1 Tax=Nitriliruptor alkaliphilus TaxID=427918 RepID=UPI000695C828|nr:maleylpyruvate isomerase N-terminal domain-containing protein [Nitriliruptor alkaliphilus]
MDTATATAIVAEESARFLRALRRTDLERVVPSTPGWSAADLAWHLAEVQWFWGAVVADLLDDVEPLVEPERPTSDRELLATVARRSADLVTALERRDGSEACWSWFEGGGHVGWVARRQAHEAIIHRVDAELVAGAPVSDVAPAVAADGIDELLRDMIATPSWASFHPDGTAVRVDATDTGDSWVLGFGRFTGTSPATGERYDQDVARVLEDAEDVVVGTTISGAAWDLDRWLWGRGPADPLRLGGDASVAFRLRAIAEVE